MDLTDLTSDELEYLNTLSEGLRPAAAKLLNDEVAFVGAAKSLCILVSDLFAYAVADAEPVSVDEIPLVASIYEEFGFYGLVCWVAKLRNENPVIEVCEKEKFKQAWQQMYGDAQVGDNFCNKSIERW